MDVLAALQIAEATASRQNIGTTIADLRTLYGVYGQVAAGKFDAAAMAKAGTLEPAAAALARSSGLLDALLKDQAEAPHVLALLASLA